MSTVRFALSFSVFPHFLNVSISGQKKAAGRLDHKKTEGSKTGEK